MPEQEDGLLAGYQLWINLPAAHKMTQPAYQEYDAAQIPLEKRAGASVKVIAGITSQGTAGPVSQPLTEPLYLDVALQPGAIFEEPLPAGHNAFIQVVEGELSVVDDERSSTLKRDQLAVLGNGERIIVKAGAQPGRFLLVAGKPLNETIARAGPFVMNTEAELRQAFSDYQSGRF
jgi:hypothetical protein